MKKEIYKYHIKQNFIIKNELICHKAEILPIIFHHNDKLPIILQYLYVYILPGYQFQSYKFPNHLLLPKLPALMLLIDYFLFYKPENINNILRLIINLKSYIKHI